MVEKNIILPASAILVSFLHNKKEKKKKNQFQKN